MTSPNILGDMLGQTQEQLNQVVKPVTATIVTHDGQNCTIKIPSISDEVQGPFPYVNPATGYGISDYAVCPPGFTVLVIQDELDNWWVIAP